MNTTPSKLLLRHLNKHVFKQLFSYKSQNNDFTGRIKLLKYFGLSTILAAIMSSYYMVKHQENAKGLIPTNLQEKELKSLENKLDSKPDDKDENIRDHFNFIDKVVKKCASAVFYLEIKDPFKKDPETGEPIITSNGSGFIISEDGWALTNAHVVLNKPQSTITAIMRDGMSYSVHVEDADLNIDLALLKLNSKDKLPVLPFAESGDATVGEWVVALGSPLSLSNSVTVGIVSCVNRPSEELGLKNYSMKYIQTDASITFGNSGGPLVNLDGHVIGINNLRLTSGISFAIPIEYVKKFLENSKYRLKSTSHQGIMGKTMFGITTISVTSEVIKQFHIVPEGVTAGLLVWKVLEGTPAHRSGLEIGDIITHINGVPVKEAGELYTLSQMGKTVEIELIKRGRKKRISLNIVDT